MAKRATAEAADRAVNGPDYDAALAIINGRLSDAKDAQSTASGRASQAWGDIEKLGVNKRGAQMFSRVQNIEDEAERQDQLRTFYKLCELEGIGLAVDLVDQAQGKTSHVAPTTSAPAAAPAPAPTPAPAPAPGAPAETGKLDETPKPKPAGKASLKVVGGAAARDAAKAHLGGRAAPDAMD